MGIYCGDVIHGVKLYTITDGGDIEVGCFMGSDCVEKARTLPCSYCMALVDVLTTYEPNGTTSQMWIKWHLTS
jgi:hypothetical protein